MESAETKEPIWGEPPATARGASKRKWLPYLKPFKQRPGQWGRIPVTFGTPRQAYSLTTRINSGEVSGIKAGEFKAETRRLNGAEGTDEIVFGVWVCYPKD